MVFYLNRIDVLQLTEGGNKVTKYMEVEKELRARLEDKEFIKWVIEDLERWQLGLILLACEIKMPPRSIEKLHRRFLLNKIITARKKLIQIKMLPPYPFILEGKERELSEEKIFKVAKEHDLGEKGIALMLFLQNHYEAALKVYDERGKNKEIQVKEVDASKEKVEILSPKIERKLQEKIKNLTNVKLELTNQLVTIKEELKQKNKDYQIEINQLKQQIAENKKTAESFIEDYKQLEAALEKEMSEKSHLSAKILVLETMKKELPKKEKRIAFIGNPMNHAIVENAEYEIDVYELDDIESFIAQWTSYNLIFYLAYTIDKMVYEEAVPLSIRENIEHVENFMRLKEKVGEL